MSEAVRIPGPMPFTQLLDEALRWSRRHFRSLLLPMAIPVCTMAGLMAAAQGFWFSHFGASKPGEVPDFGAVMSGALAFFMVVLLFIVVQVLGYVAMIVAACRVVAGQDGSVGAAWATACGLRSFGTVLLSGLAVVLGSMCCLVPGIYVGLLLSMVVPVMVLESLYGPDAIRRSAELAMHNPSREFTADPRVKIFVMVFVGYLVGWALSFVIQLPIAVVQQVLMFRMMGSGEGADPAQLMVKMAWIQTPATMLGAFAQLLMHLYISFGIALLYQDLKQRREGHDLEAAIARMEVPGGVETT
jgi:hypothetical protein